MSSPLFDTVAVNAVAADAALSGHFGDRIGRKSTLGASAVPIGALPTYQ